MDSQIEALFVITHAPAPALALASGVDDEVPFWALVWGPPAATVHSRTAKVFETLGDRQNVARSYATAAASRPGAAVARIIALDLMAQAEQQAHEGVLEQECAT
ncbi:hypothetical protein O1L68_00135 [Streptomyces lydicus]|nr:hypothetical protein [Streptomyces lydicus]